MWPYWLLFCFAAWMSFQRVERKIPEAKLDTRWPLAWVVCFVVLTLVIGLRHEVGGIGVVTKGTLTTLLAKQLKEYF